MDSPVITEVTACEVFHIGTAFPYTYFGEFDLDIPENGLEWSRPLSPKHLSFMLNN